MQGDGNQNQSISGEACTSKDSSVFPIVLVILLLIFGGIYFFKNMKSATSEPVATTSPEAVGNMEVAVVADKEFTISGASLKFDPSTLTVNEGDVVKITFKVPKGMHDFVIDEFNVQTNILEEGQEEVVIFTADKKGIYEFYCSVEDHREKGMVGSLIVE